ANIVWRGQHKNARFKITDSAGASIQLTVAASIKLKNLQTTNLGTRTWGTPSAPNAIVNVYDGAQRMWNRSLSQSSRMVTHFTGVEIRTFDSSTCPTSSAQGSQNRIIMDDNSAYRPQSRILHEMG